MAQRLALYRKWRPLTFDQVFGQEHVTHTLQSQVESDRISHAYLFTGTRGTGKTSCAKILARAVCCTDPINGNPCNQCPACLSILEESALDVTEIDAASNNGVDNIRELRDEAFFAPSALKYRVYIIDEVHMLSPGAFNALLKTLEEPPAHVLFILATTEIHKVPSTILSRCQRYDFRRIPPEIIATLLTGLASQEGYILEADAAALLARLGDGSARDAISLLDRSLPAEGTIDRAQVTGALGVASFESLTALLEALLAGEAGLALEVFTACYLDGQDLVSIFDELLSLIRDIYILGTTGREEYLMSSSASDPALLRRYAEDCNVRLLEYFIDCISDLLRKLTRTAIKRTDAEICLLKMALRHQSGVTAAVLPGPIAATAAVGPTAATAPTGPVGPPGAQTPAAQSSDDLPPWDTASANASKAPATAAETSIEESRPAQIEAPAAPAKTAQGVPGDWKARLTAAVSPRVNSAVRTYLGLADVENIDNTLHISVLEESLVFMEKPAVVRILEDGAKTLDCSGVKIKSKAAGDNKAVSGKPQPAAAATPTPAGNPAEEILNRARNMGIQIKQNQP